MPFIWNVSDKVGPFNCANRPTDVELLKLLLVIGLGAPQMRSANTGTQMQPKHDSTFDPVLGFYIFRLQQIGRTPVVDGIASSARGTNFAPGTPWVVYWFNLFARIADKELWENLPRSFGMSGALKAELTR